MIGDYIIKLILENPNKLKKLGIKQNNNYLEISYNICGVEFIIKV